MKKLFLFLFVVLVAGYVYWPYQSTGNFRDALTATDKSALEPLVDWPSVRDSLKEQFQSKLEKLSRDSRGQKTLTPAEITSIKNYSSQVVDAKINAEEVAAQGKRRVGAPDLEKVEITERSWKSVSEMTVQTNVDKSTYTFRFGGFGWKLVDWEIDDVTFQAMLRPQTAAGPNGSPAPAAAGAPQLPFPIAGQDGPKQKDQWIFKDYKNPLDKKPVEKPKGR